MDLSLLDRITPLIGIVAAERTRERPDLYDDARQEGLIRAWTVLEQRPDAPREYLVAAAKRGVGDVIRGRPAFGATSHRGRQDAHDLSGPLVHRTADEGEELVAEPEDPAPVSALDSVAVVSVVRRAVSALDDPTDRLMVFERYWLDLGFDEIAQHVGRPKGTLSRRWTEKVRPELRERLKSLAA